MARGIFWTTAPEEISISTATIGHMYWLYRADANYDQDVTEEINQEDDYFFVIGSRKKTMHIWKDKSGWI
jgi:hypothetical protein